MNKKDKSVLDILHFNRNSFFNIFENAKEGDFEDYLAMQEDRYLSGIEKSNGVVFSKIRRVILDKEYFDWLEKNDLREEEFSRVKYASSLNDEEVGRLWKKNNRHEKIFTRVIPVSVSYYEPFKLNVKINSIQKRELSESISKSLSISPDCVFIYNNLVKGEEITNEFMNGKIVKEAMDYFSSCIGEGKDEVRSNGIKSSYYLPIALLDKEAAVMEREEFEAEMKESRKFATNVMAKTLEKGFDKDGIKVNVASVLLDIETLKDFNYIY